MGLNLILTANNSPVTVGGGGDWQLAAGHFIPAKMPPNIIHPRPDAETAAWARCRRAPSGIEWSIPVSVQGGAWPFKYELTTAPSGMTIGETLPSDWLTNGLGNYGVITWGTPTIGTHTIVVRVIDQDGTVVTRTWTLEVIDRENTNYFIFVSASGGLNSNSGAYSSPKADITGWYGSAYNVSTYPGRQVFYRAGTYTIPSAAVSNYKFDVRASYGKPVVFVAYPGESVIIDNGTFPGCMYEMSNHFTGDVCFHGIRWVNPQAWADIGGGYINYRKCFLRIATSSSRTLFFRNVFDGGGNTRSDDSTNSSVIFFTGGAGNYHAVVHNEFYNCDNMDTALLYDNQDNLFEGNLISGTYGGVSNWNKAWGYFIKGSTDAGSGVRRITARANRHDGTEKYNQLVFCSEFTGHYKGEIEVCWNNYYSTASFTESGVAGSGCFGLGQGSGGTGTTYGNFWSYRNNWRVPHMSVITFQSGSNNWENDVIQHSGTYTDGISVYNSSVSPVKTNLAAGTSATITLDAATNLLTGAARMTYLGTHGCEVA